MKRDRQIIQEIISRMLDNPRECGIYPTGTAFVELEHYVEQQRLQAIGCILLDNEEDPRIIEVPDLMERVLTDLA